MALAIPPIKRGIYALAVLLVIFLAGLKFFGVDRQLLLILAIASALLVGLLLITYRAFEGVAETARRSLQTPSSAYHDEDKEHR